MMPVIKKFMADCQLPYVTVVTVVTVVADAGKISAANQKAIEAAGLEIGRSCVQTVLAGSGMCHRQTLGCGSPGA
jgi:hypothetical protein